MSSLQDLDKRLRALETELEISKRRRASIAKSVHKALSSLSEPQIALLQTVNPAIAVVAKYTEDAIFRNENQELQTIIDVTKQLTEFADRRLHYFEDQLC